MAKPSLHPGDRFPNLTVVERLEGVRNAARDCVWLVRCDCGNLARRRTSGLTRKGKLPKTCGRCEPAPMTPLGDVARHLAEEIYPRALRLASVYVRRYPQYRDNIHSSAGYATVLSAVDYDEKAFIRKVYRQIRDDLRADFKCRKRMEDLVRKVAQLHDGFQ